MFRTRNPQNVACQAEMVDAETLRLRITSSVWQYSGLETQALARTGTGLVRVIVDVSCVEQMSSAALAQLVLLKHRVNLWGGQMQTLGLHGQPLGLCEVLGLTGLLLACSVEASGAPCGHKENPRITDPQAEAAMEAPLPALSAA